MRAFFLGFLLLAAGPALAADKYVGSNADVRTILAFKAADAAIQKFLPEGWELDVATTGPAKDVNLRVTFIDRLAAQDAEGKAVAPVRTVTLSVPAKKQGSETRGTMLFAIYTSGGSGGPYGVSVHADTKMERKVATDPAGSAVVEEVVAISSPRRQFPPAADPICARRAHAGKGGIIALLGGQAGFLPHLSVRTVGRCGARRGRRPRSEDRLQGLRSEARTVVRWLRAAGRRHLASLVYAPDLPARVVARGCSRAPPPRPCTARGPGYIWGLRDG